MNVSIFDYLYECCMNYMDMLIAESLEYLYYSEKDGAFRNVYIDHTTGKAMNCIAKEMILRGEY